MTNDAVIRFGHVANPFASPLTHAIDEGAFAAGGIEVEMTRLRNGSEVANLLDLGEIDVGLGGHLQTLSAALSGSDQAFFSGLGFEAAPDHLPVAMVVRAEESSDGIAPGSAIGMSALAAISDLQLRIFIADLGVAYDSLEIVTMPFNEMQSALDNGDIDAASIPDPFASEIVASGAGRIVDRGTLSRRMPRDGRVMITGLVSTKRWIDDHRELAASIVQVIREAVASTPQWTALAPMTTMGAQHLHRPTFDTQLRGEDLQLAFDLAATYGVVSASIPAESVIATL